ncbi:MAG: hypothetical protein OEZ39_14105 [Gammaproteobacteria bacterium]|nr:hypothetical protein [Gammaproteobacteria bacterium]
MSEYHWISCTTAQHRVELYGEVIEDEIFSTNNAESPDPIPVFKLVSLAALRVRNYTDQHVNETVYIDLEELFPEDPLILASVATPEETDNQSVDDDSLPPPYRLQTIFSDELILEGVEAPESHFLDVMPVSGWKLVIRQNLDKHIIKCEADLYLLAEWEMDTHPDYYPGSTFGEISMTGRGTSETDTDLQIEIPWPMAINGRLGLLAPERIDGEWRSTIDLERTVSIFDGAGLALRDFKFGAIDLSFLTEQLKTLPGSVKDYLRFETGLRLNGDLFFRLKVVAPDRLPLAELSGLSLVLKSGVAFVLEGTFTDTHLELQVYLSLLSGSGFVLEGPLLAQIESATESALEAVSFLPSNVIPNVSDIPKIELSLVTSQTMRYDLAQVNLPLRWDVVPDFPDFINDLSTISLTDLIGDNLIGYSIALLDGDTPKVQLIVQDFDPIISGDELGATLSIRIRVEASPGEPPFELTGTWGFRFELETFSFIPGRSIQFTSSGLNFRAGGLHITGLQSFAVDWQSGQLSLSANNISAYYDGLTAPGDDSPGFALNISNISISSGGLDLDIEAKGGVTKVVGVGESFKGAKGSAVIRNSRIQNAQLTVEGPLPWLDNATGSMTILFKEGFRPDQVKSEFQLGLHKKTDWWLELELNAVAIDISFNDGRPALVIKITGAIMIVPPNGAGNFLATYLKKARMEFHELPLTRDFAAIPAHLSLYVELNKPDKVKLLEVFGFEIRGIGIGPGSDPGEAALVISGQIFFSSADLLSLEIDFHKLKMQKPAQDSILPRISLERLGLRFQKKPAIDISGFVSFLDEDTRRGFTGRGHISVGDTFGMDVIMEFVVVERPADGKKLRVWMIYIDVLNLNQPFIAPFILRDAGLGFGWRKTIHIMDDPNLFTAEPDKSSRTVGPHLPSSWEDDLDGEEANWTLCMSAAITLGPTPRSTPSILAGDILLGLRSDLTIFIGARAWPFMSLDSVKSGSQSNRPIMYGFIYYSLRRKHLLTTLVTDPAGAAPEGVPPQLIQALVGDPFSITLETRPGLFRFELGLPRQLKINLQPWTGWAGMLIRQTGNSLTVGLGFEIGLEFSFSSGVNLGFFGFSISVYGRISVFGDIYARVGNSPALYGTVGVNAILLLTIAAWVAIKIGWFKISFRFSFGFQLMMTARVSFGIAASFGVEGYTAVSLRIWKFSIGASVAIAINRGALNEARRRVFEGTNFAGAGDAPTHRRYLPNGMGEIPAVIESESGRKWSAMHIQKIDPATGNTLIYTLLLPEDDSWLACPSAPTGPDWEIDGEDYRFRFELKNTACRTHLGSTTTFDPQATVIEASYRCPWNNSVHSPGLEKENDHAPDIRLGDILYEPEAVKEQLKVIQTILEDDHYRPELLTDWRVRAEKEATDNAPGIRPDVRSPQFSADGSFYDMALEEAFGYGEDNLSWHRIALGLTRWPQEVLNNEAFLDFVCEKGEDGAYLNINEETIIGGAERLSSNRASLVNMLLDEFRDWAVNGTTPEDGLLFQSGLAFQFESASSDWEIKATHIEANQGFGVKHSLSCANAQIENFHITPGAGGIGFRRNEYRYRIKDILEFQESSGIHFSWILECLDPDNVSSIMTHEELSGLGQKGHFEYFHHYEIERINLTRDSRSENTDVHFKVSIAYIPSLLDIGAGQAEFFICAPRFEFSDLFESPADIGDLLLYRITAVDVFGNRSQTAEYITARKQLAAPPPPNKGSVAYTVRLSTESIEEETLDIQIEAGDLAAWSDEPVYHEIWVRSFPLAQSGFYGLGDDLEDDPDDIDNEPLLEPKGMSLVSAMQENSLQGGNELVEKLARGFVYEFYVRTVSASGNASRLVRAEILNYIHGPAGAAKEDETEKPQALLERIPPPTNMAEQWLQPDAVRAEIQLAAEPVVHFNTDSKTEISYRPMANPAERELTLRLMHEAYLDENHIHPTGGYEVYCRDRDVSTIDDAQHYQKLAEVEVISMERYLSNPENTDLLSAWRANYKGPGQIPAYEQINQTEGHDLGYLDWEDNSPATSGAALENFPEGALVNAKLENLLVRLQEKTRDRGYAIAYTNVLPQKEELEQLSFASLLEDFNDEKDKNGTGLLKKLGRSVDIELRRETETIRSNELLSILREIDVGRTDHVYLELLFQSDRNSPMQRYRLSLLPVIKALPTPADIERDFPLLPETDRPAKLQEEIDKLRDHAFAGFRNCLELALISLAGALEEGARESYEGLMRRFLRQRPIMPPQTRVLPGAAYYSDNGAISRPVNADHTLSIQLYYQLALAKRFAYRIKRVSRYLPLYKKLGIWSENLWSTEDTAMQVRFARIKEPAPPIIQFLGVKQRNGIPFAEWLIEEHDEELLTQSNETLRNRLGYRGIAWSLFTERNFDWERWSGWENDAWKARSLTPDDGGLAGLNAEEKALLAKDAAWKNGDPNNFPPAGLQGHPFTGQLEPKGSVIRTPELPYYYRYRLGAFTRCDDLDSPVKMVDAAEVFAAKTPEVDQTSAGFRLNDAGEIEFIWRIPSAWQSLSEKEQALWPNEKPYATRLWDFDLCYTLQLRRQGILRPLFHLRLIADENTRPDDGPWFSVQTMASYLYKDPVKKGRVEFLDPVTIPSPFLPKLSVRLRGTDKLISWIKREDDFVFELHCSRARGDSPPTRNRIGRLNENEMEAKTS